MDGTILQDLQHLLSQCLAALAALGEHLAQHAGNALLGADPVSYTHLDVYKRQPHSFVNLPAEEQEKLLKEYGSQKAAEKALEEKYGDVYKRQSLCPTAALTMIWSTCGQTASRWTSRST